MTLNDIIVSALAQLDRGHDGQTIDTWRDKFARYANEAIADLAGVLRVRRTDILLMQNGYVDTSTLPRCCVKILRVQRNFRNMPFMTGSSSTKVRVLCEDGPVEIQYRYLPNDIYSPTDVPEIPAYCHGIIVLYVIARERASADPSMQRGSSVYFELYNAAKRQLCASLGEEDNYKIINWW